MKNEMSILNCGVRLAERRPLRTAARSATARRRRAGEQAEHRHADQEDQLTVRVERHPVSVGAAGAAEHPGTEHRPHSVRHQHVAADDADHNQGADDEQQDLGDEHTGEDRRVSNRVVPEVVGENTGEEKNKTTIATRAIATGSSSRGRRGKRIALPRSGGPEAQGQPLVVEHGRCLATYTGEGSVTFRPLGHGRATTPAGRVQRYQRMGNPDECPIHDPEP